MKKGITKDMEALGLFDIKLVPSSKPGEAYIVSKRRDGWRCECRAFQNGKNCRHIREAQS